MKELKLESIISFGVLTVLSVYPFAYPDYSWGAPALKEVVILPSAPRIPYSCDSGKDGLQRIYYENGLLYQEINCLGYMRDGDSRKYYPDGKLWIAEKYKFDKLHGIFQEYYQNGVLKKEGVYIRGLLEAELREYDEKGQLKIEESYKKGKKDGPYRVFENGQVKSEIIYQEDKPVNPLAGDPNRKLNALSVKGINDPEDNFHATSLPTDTPNLETISVVPVRKIEGARSVGKNAQKDFSSEEFWK